MNPDELKKILDLHRKWRDGNPSGVKADLSDADLSGAYLGDANLRGANLSGAYLSGANLMEITLCGACIDGAKLSTGALDSPGHILCALTDDEWAYVKKKRARK